MEADAFLRVDGFPMNSIDPAVRRWLSEGKQVALATVLRTWGSAPRKAGAKMAVSESGEMSGSVSGGCVEGAVVEGALRSLSTRHPSILEFSVSDETAWGVGLACGGRIEILVEPLPPTHYGLLSTALQEQIPAASLVITSGPEGLVGRRRSLLRVDPPKEINDLEGAFPMDLQEVLLQGASQAVPQWIEIELKGQQVTAFVDPVPLKPVLLIVGGVHIAIALASLANVIGFSTIVIDPRRSFGSQERFQHVDQLIQAWPQDALKEISIGPHTAVAVLTHDPKIDDPAVQAALRSEAFYVGVLGSPRTHEKRLNRLAELGLTPDELGRLHAPIGLDIGASEPEEIALAIMAEIVQTRRRSG